MAMTIWSVHVHSTMPLKSKESTHDVHLPAPTSATKHMLSLEVHVSSSTATLGKQLMDHLQVSIVACPPEPSLRTTTIFCMHIHCHLIGECQELADNTQVAISTSIPEAILILCMHIHCKITRQRQQTSDQLQVPAPTCSLKPSCGVCSTQRLGQRGGLVTGPSQDAPQAVCIKLSTRLFPLCRSRLWGALACHRVCGARWQLPHGCDVHGKMQRGQHSAGQTP